MSLGSVPTEGSGFPTAARSPGSLAASQIIQDQLALLCGPDKLQSPCPVLERGRDFRAQRGPGVPKAKKRASEPLVPASPLPGGPGSQPHATQEGSAGVQMGGQ